MEKKKFAKVPSRKDFYDKSYEYIKHKHDENRIRKFLIEHIDLDVEKRSPVMHRIYDTIMPMNWRKRPDKESMEKCYKDTIDLIENIKGTRLSSSVAGTIKRYIWYLDKFMFYAEKDYSDVSKMIPDKARLALGFPVPLIRLTYEYMPKVKAKKSLMMIANDIDSYCKKHRVYNMEESDEWWAELK